MDDSSVTCSLIKLVLGRDEQVEVVGQCRSGEEALSVLADLRPDLITLDVEMPGIGGLETLRRIRALDRFLPVIMFSTLTRSGAGATLDALALGADDYASKPSGAPSAEEALAAMANELLPKIKALAARRRWRALRGTTQASAVRQQNLASTMAALGALKSAGAPAPSMRPDPPVSVVALGASTGGPDALSRIVPALPADLRVPVVVVQHMPALFTALLAERLARASSIAVREATDGDHLEPGCVYIAPGDQHLTVAARGRGVVTRLDDGPKLHHSRPSVDRLFASLPAAYGARVLAIMLTGMGRDGVLGCEAVRSAGGRVTVQDEESSAVWGMAGAVFDAGLATGTVPLDRIPAHLTSLVAR